MIEKLINEIESIIGSVIYKSAREYCTSIDNILKSLMNVLPAIINVYSREELKDISQDVLYWTPEVEKFINVSKGGDRYAIYDVLYCEIRGNLIELINICKERNVQI